MPAIENFGFTSKGISAPALASCEYDFLKAAYLGLQLPIVVDGRLLANMNPAEILGSIAGAYIGARNNNQILLQATPARMYVRLFEEARRKHPGMIKGLDRIAQERKMLPYDSAKDPLSSRIERIMAEHPDIEKEIREKMVDLKMQFEDGARYGLLDPNVDARTKGFNNKHLYTKGIVRNMKSIYDEYARKHSASQKIAEVRPAANVLPVEANPAAADSQLQLL